MTPIIPIPPPSRDEVLDAIRHIESKNGCTHLPLYPHIDGVSWGEYGLTQQALDELFNRGLLKHRVEIRANTPEVMQRFCALLYLSVSMDEVDKVAKWDTFDACGIPVSLDGASEIIKDTLGRTWVHAAGVYLAWTGDQAAQSRATYMHEACKRIAAMRS